MEIRAIRVKRLRELVEQANGPAAFARAYPGVDPTYISQLLNGHRSLGEKAARRLEILIGRPALWFDRDEPHDYDKGTNTAVIESTGAAYADVPIIATAVPKETAFQGGHMRVPVQWIDLWGASPEHVVFIAAGDGSMSPSIQQGSQCIGDRSQTEIQSGARYCIESGGEVKIRTLVRRSDGSITVVAEADQPRWPPEVVPADQAASIRVIARVIGVFNKL